MKEIDRGLEGKTPDFEDLKKLPYLQMVIDESLRLFPPVVRFSLPSFSFSHTHLTPLPHLKSHIYLLTFSLRLPLISHYQLTPHST
jgi:hypothetical protein